MGLKLRRETELEQRLGHEGHLNLWECGSHPVCRAEGKEAWYSGQAGLQRELSKREQEYQEPR